MGLSVAVAMSAIKARADIVNVAPDGAPSVSAPLYGNQSIWQLNNGVTDDVFHGDSSLPAGFAYTLDLGKSYPVHELRVYPRQDGCCPDRLTNLRVSVHTDDGVGGMAAEVWGMDLFTDGANPGSAPGTVVKVTPPRPQAGRWVEIRSLADPVPNYALQLSELEVLAEVRDREGGVAGRSTYRWYQYRHGKRQERCPHHRLASDRSIPRPVDSDSLPR
jgi:hypothetical protein